MELGRKMNHVYLRANAQPGGVRSYGDVVDLLLAERRQAFAKPGPRESGEQEAE